MENQNGIVLAMFGTSVEEALPALLNIRDRVVARFPEAAVRIAFTSNFIRRIWRDRATSPDYLRAHPDIPADILYAPEPLAAIASFQEEGIGSVIVQPVHIAPSEEFIDLASYVEGLDAMESVHAQPFARLILGRPALGTLGTTYPYVRDIIAAAQTLASDADLAKEKQSALVYMGHGNKNVPESDVYLEFAAEMNRQYPDALTVMATLDGIPSLDDAICHLKEKNVMKVILKPFMVAAGKHAMDDMLGVKPESLKNRLEKAGFSVSPVVQGLGEQDAFADIFVQHIDDAARDAGIRLG